MECGSDSAADNFLVLFNIIYIMKSSQEKRGEVVYVFLVQNSHIIRPIPSAGIPMGSHQPDKALSIH